MLTDSTLRCENRQFDGTGGRSEENRVLGFEPAFFDTETERVYRACFADGRPAPCHLLDGLPGEIVLERDPSGRVSGVKGSIVAGFLRGERFYTRDEAAQAVAI